MAEFTKTVYVPIEITTSNKITDEQALKIAEIIFDDTTNSVEAVSKEAQIKIEDWAVYKPVTGWDIGKDYLPRA